MQLSKGRPRSIAVDTTTPLPALPKSPSTSSIPPPTSLPHLSPHGPATSRNYGAPPLSNAALSPNIQQGILTYVNDSLLNYHRI